jgi:CheY-like chemotaxis protein
VENNAVALDILSSSLQHAGMIVTGSSGPELEAKLTQGSNSDCAYDFGIIDLPLPDNKAQEMITRLRASDILMPESLLIGLTQLMDTQAQIYKERGIDYLLTKPVRRSKLFKLLQDKLRKEASSYQQKGSPADKKKKGTHTQEAQAKTSRILLAEDNLVNQKLAKLMLNKSGYDVDVAGNGIEAIEKLTAQPQMFDLIFMDVQMPEMDGIEATEEIRRRGFKSIPIVAMTAHALREDREKCLAAGMNEYITKPIKKELIHQVLQKFDL